MRKHLIGIQHFEILGMNFFLLRLVSDDGDPFSKYCEKSPLSPQKVLG